MANNFGGIPIEQDTPGGGGRFGGVPVEGQQEPIQPDATAAPQAEQPAIDPIRQGALAELQKRMYAKAISDLKAGTTAGVPARIEEGGELLSGQGIVEAQQPTGAISTITGKPLTEFAPTGQEPAGFGAIAKTGFVEDPEKKIEIFARSRFPSTPLAEARKRYGIMKTDPATGEEIPGGAVVYLGNDNRVYREIPKGSPQQIKKFIAEIPGELPAIAGGTAGAVLGAAGGPVASAAAAGAGGALGETLRQAIGKTFFGDPVSGGKIALEGALGATGEIGGRLAAKGIQKVLTNRGRTLAKAAAGDVGKFDKAAIQKAHADAKEYGVELFSPQTTESPELIDKFKLLSDMPETANLLRGASRVQQEQVQGAIQQFADEVAADPVTQFTTGKRLSDTAEAVIEKLKKNRSELARPYYQESFESPVKLDYAPVLGKIDGLLAATPPGSKSRLALNRVRKMIDNAPAVYDEVVKDAPLVTSEKGLQRETVEIFPKGEGLPKPEIIMPAVKMKNGDVVYGKKSQTHLNIIEDAGVDAANVETGGWVTPDGYTASQSDATAAAERARAARRVAEKRAERKASRVAAQPSPIKYLNNVKQEIDAMLKGPDSLAIAKNAKRALSETKDSLTTMADEASPMYAEARKVFSELSPQVTEAEQSIIGNLAKLEGDQVTQASKKLFSSITASPESVKYARTLIKENNPDVWDQAIKTYLVDTFEGIKKSVTGEFANLGGQFYKKTIGDVKQQKILREALGKQGFENFENFADVLKKTSLTTGKESATATRQIALKQMREKGESKLLRLGEFDITAPFKGISRKLNDLLFGRYNKKLAEALISPKAAKRLEKIGKLSNDTKKQMREFSTFLSLAIGGEYTKPGLEEMEIPFETLREGAAE